MEYKILQHRDPVYLADLINIEMKKGWRPQGGVAKAKHQEYMQAMIKD